MKPSLFLAAALLISPAALRAEDPASAAPATTPAPAPAATEAAPAKSAAPDAGKKDHPRAKALREKMLQRHDSDRDGKLSPEERAAAKADFQSKVATLRQKAKELFDTDKDGKLSDEERATAKEVLKAKAAKKNPAKAGKDEPAGERQKAAAALRLKALEKFDADHDGQLSETERAAARAARKNRNEP